MIGKTKYSVVFPVLGLFSQISIPPHIVLGGTYPFCHTNSLDTVIHIISGNIHVNPVELGLRLHFTEVEA